MAIDKMLIAGSTGMMLLKLLSEKDMYGYEMIETLRERSQNVFELKAGTLYPLLHGLESKGLVTSYEEESIGKMRKYYHITKSGEKYLKDKTEEWTLYRDAVTNVLSMGGLA
ncbi:MAG: PadR family transcriptional regulator [Lachnospiraceae bacterium]|nr:PadR family transcriptional regulator [Lachnospiraceae bacterium]